MLSSNHKSHKDVAINALPSLTDLARVSPPKSRYLLEDFRSPMHVFEASELTRNSSRHDSENHGLQIRFSLIDQPRVRRFRHAAAGGALR